MSDEDQKRYQAATHAMQSGVAMKMNYDPSETTPKHLRVGVNSALSNAGALAKLLIAKGVFTEDEYVKAVADQMESEALSYEAWLRDKLGAKITLS